MDGTTNKNKNSETDGAGACTFLLLTVSGEGEDPSFPPPLIKRTSEGKTLLLHINMPCLTYLESGLEVEERGTEGSPHHAFACLSLLSGQDRDGTIHVNKLNVMIITNVSCFCLSFLGRHPLSWRRDLATPILRQAGWLPETLLPQALCLHSELLLGSPSTCVCILNDAFSTLLAPCLCCCAHLLIPLLSDPLTETIQKFLKQKLKKVMKK